MTPRHNKPCRRLGKSGEPLARALVHAVVRTTVCRNDTRSVDNQVDTLPPPEGRSLGWSQRRSWRL